MNKFICMGLVINLMMSIFILFKLHTVTDQLSTVGTKILNMADSIAQYMQKRYLIVEPAIVEQYNQAQATIKGQRHVLDMWDSCQLCQDRCVDPAGKPITPGSIGLPKPVNAE
jgi:hypothetical protein